MVLNRVRPEFADGRISFGDLSWHQMSLFWVQFGLLAVNIYPRNDRFSVVGVAADWIRIPCFRLDRRPNSTCFMT